MSEATSQKHLSLVGVEKFFDPEKPILRDLNLNFGIDKFSGLLGPSGCGKSTLLRIIAGLEKPTRGFISFDGEVWVDTAKNFFLPPEKRKIGMVFQNYALWPHMSVRDNVLFPLRMQKRSSSEIAELLPKYLAKVELEGLEDRFPHEISGGQQQRVALARALIQRPKLLLMDEPLSNLDASLRSNVRERIKNLQFEEKVTALVVTHDWEDAESLCGELVILNHGVAEQCGTPEEIAKNPKTDFVRRIIR